jgi:uncharacterized small protein (DUF1192 family)
MAAQQVTHRQVLVGHNCDSCQKQLRGTFFQCYLCLEVPFRQCRECLNADIKGTPSQRKHKHPTSHMLTQVNFRAYNALDGNIGYHCKACPEGENHISGRIFKCNEPHCLDDMFCEACSKTHRCSDNTQEEAASRMIMVPQNYLIGFNPHLETDDGLCRHPLYDDPLPLFQELKWDSCTAVGMTKVICDLMQEVYLVRVDFRRLYFSMLANIRIEYGCAASFFIGKFKEWMVHMQRQGGGITTECGQLLTFDLIYHRMPGTTHNFEDFTLPETHRRIQNFYFECSPEEKAKRLQEIARTDADHQTKLLVSIPITRNSNRIFRIADVRGIHTQRHDYVNMHGQIASDASDGTPRHFGQHLAELVGEDLQNNLVVDMLWSGAGHDSVQKLPKDEFCCSFFHRIQVCRARLDGELIQTRLGWQCTKLRENRNKAVTVKLYDEEVQELTNELSAANKEIRRLKAELLNCQQERDKTDEASVKAGEKRKRD